MTGEENPQAPFTQLATQDEHRLTRRRLLELGVALPLPLVLAACSGGDDSGVPEAQPTTTGTATLAPTPACDDGDEVTPEQTEGPFFTPDSPERASLLEPGIEGTRLVLAGSVLGLDCQPVAGALLDFWHADAEGAYDNEGYRLRGHQFADERGAYRLDTVVPGLYTGRTRHIHVKAQAANGSVLTTQLYFRGEPGNESDGLFDQALLMDVGAEGGSGRFDFVLQV
jgi:protocatechuate 3,4-dioxygenase beta subunit